MVKVFFPQFGHARQIGRLHTFDTGRAVYQPRNGGGIAQVGGEFRVGVLQKVALAGEAAHLGGERRKVDQVFVPDLAVCARQNLENTHAVSAPLLEVKAELGFLSGGAQ
ncbi:hypothetical protein Mag101_12330 [Microbulbifer agarilyticus]|uniref:Uncharacterized protein n=1 Tax=Microbulbifer agarilyticus TaxID=260552 RepID=A0A1Q2M6J6_9GAMM|nr:hypothetical protein Mag101_12330 [Microbulbifer agarilyticus]